MCCFSRVTTQLLSQYLNQLLSAAPTVAEPDPGLRGSLLDSEISSHNFRSFSIKKEQPGRRKPGFQKGVKWEKDGGKAKESLSLLSQRIQILGLSQPAFVSASCPDDFKKVAGNEEKHNLGYPVLQAKKQEVDCCLTMCALPAIANESKGLLILLVLAPCRIKWISSSIKDFSYLQQYSAKTSELSKWASAGFK